MRGSTWLRFRVTLLCTDALARGPFRDILDHGGGVLGIIGIIGEFRQPVHAGEQMDTPAIESTARPGIVRGRCPVVRHASRTRSQGLR